MKELISKTIAIGLILNPLRSFAEDSKAQIKAIINALKSAKHDTRFSSQTDRIQIIESLSNSQKESIILQLLDEANQNLRFESTNRLEDADYVRDVGARSFRQQ